MAGHNAWLVPVGPRQRANCALPARTKRFLQPPGFPGKVDGLREGRNILGRNADRLGYLRPRQRESYSPLSGALGKSQDVSFRGPRWCSLGHIVIERRLGGG